jgi:glycosyltransferase involved in cell wall biosynthesis
MSDMPPAKPRLLLFVTDLHRGGTPTVVRELAVRLRARGHDVEVACLDRQGVTGEELVATGVPVHPLNARSRGDVRVLRGLHRLLREREYTHVLSFLVHANTVAALAGRIRQDIRWFQSIQTTQAKPAWHWPLQRLAARRARAVIVPSPSVAAVARARCHIPEERIVVIPNAVDAEALASLTRAHRTANFRIGFIGRLDPIKRIPDLISALRLLPGPFELHLFGDGPERGRLEFLAAGLPITFHGSVASPAVAMALIDVLVLPSEAEGFGLVLIEAMAAGIPVIASAAPGIVDIVNHGSNGLLFPIGHVAELAALIRHVADHPDALGPVLEAARRTVRDKYAFPAVLAHYERTLGL